MSTQLVGSQARGDHYTQEWQVLVSDRHLAGHFDNGAVRKGPFLCACICAS